MNRKKGQKISWMSYRGCTATGWEDVNDVGTMDK